MHACLQLLETLLSIKFMQAERVCKRESSTSIQREHDMHMLERALQRINAKIKDFSLCNCSPSLSLSLPLARALCLTTLSVRLTSTQSVTIEQTEHVYPN